MWLKSLLGFQQGAISSLLLQKEEWEAEVSCDFAMIKTRSITEDFKSGICNLQAWSPTR